MAKTHDPAHTLESLCVQKSMAGIRVHPDSVNIVWEVNIKKTVRRATMAAFMTRHM